MSGFTDLVNTYVDDPGGGVFGPIWRKIKEGFGDIQDWFNGLFNNKTIGPNNETPSDWLKGLLGSYGLEDFLGNFQNAGSSTAGRIMSGPDMQALFDKMDEQARAVNEFNQTSADKAMQFEANQAQLNRDFQMDLIKNGYQYAVEGMQNAGLNPALAYANGPVQVTSGAMASGSSASGQAPDYSGILKVLILALSGITTSALKLAVPKK